MLTSVFVFFLYALQGMPCAIIDVYLPQVLAAHSLPAQYVGFAYLIYIPFNFRFLFAILLDSCRQGRGIHFFLAPLLFGASLSCFVAAAFPVSIWSKDATETLANLPIAYICLAFTIFFVAMSDPATDAIGLEIYTGDNSIQIIGFKAGKWLAELVVTSLLTWFGFSWSSVMMILGITMVFAAVWTIIHESKRQHHYIPVAPSVNEGVKSLSLWQTIKSASSMLLRPPVVLLLLLALTNKFGELIVRQMFSVFFFERFSIFYKHQFPNAHDQEIMQLISTAVSGSSSVFSTVSFIASLLPLMLIILFPALRKRATSLRNLLGVLLVCYVARSASLFFMAELNISTPFATTSTNIFILPFSMDIDLLWLGTFCLFSISAGLTTSLLYSVCRVGVSEIHEARVTVYSILECADDWARLVAATSSGKLKELVTFDYLFFVGGALSTLPMFFSAGYMFGFGLAISSFIAALTFLAARIQALQNKKSL